MVAGRVDLLSARGEVVATEEKVPADVGRGPLYRSSRRASCCGGHCSICGSLEAQGQCDTMEGVPVRSRRGIGYWGLRYGQRSAHVDPLTQLFHLRQRPPSRFAATVGNGAWPQSRILGWCHRVCDLRLGGHETFELSTDAIDSTRPRGLEAVSTGDGPCVSVLRVAFRHRSIAVRFQTRLARVK